jgi:hypothetical protein
LVRSIQRFQKSEKCKKEQKFWKFHILDSGISIFTEKKSEKWTSWGCRIRYPWFQIFLNSFRFKKTYMLLGYSLFCQDILPSALALAFRKHIHNSSLKIVSFTYSTNYAHNWGYNYPFWLTLLLFIFSILLCNYSVSIVLCFFKIIWNKLEKLKIVDHATKYKISRTV